MLDWWKIRGLIFLIDLFIYQFPICKLTNILYRQKEYQNPQIDDQFPWRIDLPNYDPLSAVTLAALGTKIPFLILKVKKFKIINHPCSTNPKPTYAFSSAIANISEYFGRFRFSIHTCSIFPDASRAANSSGWYFFRCFLKITPYWKL